MRFVTDYPVAVRAGDRVWLHCVCGCGVGFLFTAPFTGEIDRWMPHGPQTPTFTGAEFLRPSGGTGA